MWQYILTKPRPWSTNIVLPKNAEQYPTLNLTSTSLNLFDLSNKFKNDAGLFLNETGLNDNHITIHPMNLSDENIGEIASSLKNQLNEFISKGI